MALQSCPEPSSTSQPRVRRELLTPPCPQRCRVATWQSRGNSDAGSKEVPRQQEGGGSEKSQAGLFPLKPLQIWAVLISRARLAASCGCSCLELGVKGFQLDANCWWDGSRRPLVALGNGAEGWESSPSPLLPPCPAPAPAGASVCTGSGVTHAGARAPGRGRMTLST